MRIGFDAKRAFLNASGLGNYSRNTINALKNYSPENKCILYTPEIRDHLFEDQRLFEVHSPESTLAKIFSPLWRSFSAKQFKRHEIDIFHGLSNELPHGINKSGIPSVVTIHDLIFMRFPEFYKPIDRKIYFRKVQYACQTAAKIIAISEQTKTDIIRFFGIDHNKIEVLYQSVSPVFFDQKNGDDIRLKYHLSDKYILSVGTLEPRKNQMALLKAIQSEKIETQVVFIGKPTSYIKKMNGFIETNHMSEQVKFINNISDSDMAALYQKASLSVYISFFEGFGLPIIEAMASGCPVITSNVSCMPETAGGAAVLCPPGDFEELGKQVKILLENENIRKQWIDKGLERATHFHPRLFSEKMISLYTSILK